ncbi:MAG: hypothetical protein ACO32U_05330 [Candidatus Limnocylindrus sp.]
MNDELQRRLEAADPLAVGEGWSRTPAQLERLKEIALMSDRQRGAARPRIVGFGVVGAAALAGILLAGSFGAQKTLAFSPNGVMATEAQMAAADSACTAPIDGASGLDFELQSLELFGNGGVAIYAKDGYYGYCMVRVDGDSVEAGIRISGNTSELKAFVEAYGSTEYADQTVSIIVGNAPEGAVSVEVVGLDGVSATVVEGRYGLWLPQSLADSATELVARDANGAELLRATIGGEVKTSPTTEPTRP